MCFARRSRPVEVVDPGVVRALEPDGLAARLLDDRRAAVAADVVERAQLAVAAADDDDVSPASRCEEVFAAIRPPPRPARRRSSRGANQLRARIEDRRVVEDARREEPGGPERAADGVELGDGQDRRRGRVGDACRAWPDRHTADFYCLPCSIRRTRRSASRDAPRGSAQGRRLPPVRDLRREAERLDLRLHHDLGLGVAVDEEHRPREAGGRPAPRPSAKWPQPVEQLGLVGVGARSR